MQRQEKILTETAAPKVPEWPSFCNFCKVNPKPAFSEKVQTGDLIVQRLEKILAQTAALIVPQWPSYGNFCEITQNPHFLKTCKGGTKENCSKIAQKTSYVWKANNHSGENVIIQYLICTKIAKTGEDFGANSGSKSARMAKLWQFSQGHPKPAFSEKVQRGNQGKFFKNRPKGSTALWRKWHYPLISMHLKCKD